MVSIEFQFLSPLYISLYLDKKTSEDKFDFTIFSISFEVGQISFKYIFFPFLPIPIGSLTISIFILPAKAKATTKGGEAR